MKHDPIKLFNDWYALELKNSTVSIPSACCLSTNGLDEYPNSRMVSLKEVIDSSFIITGSLSSRKGREIQRNNKVALTFWWTTTERQIRIQGNAFQISDEDADNYFHQRDYESKVVSNISEQGQEIENLQELIGNYNSLVTQSVNDLQRPSNWGGYKIFPVRIEFLEFNSTRFHDRKLYELVGEDWLVKQIQP